MKFLSREEILKVDDLDYEDVPVPEWGEDVGVRIRAGSSEERDEFDMEIREGNGSDAKVNVKRLRSKLLARAIVDENGKRLFSEADVDVLDKKNSRISWRLFKVAKKRWGIGQEDQDELVGESKPGRNAEPGIVLPKNGASPVLATSSAD